MLINPVLLRPDEGEPIEYEESSATVKILCNVTTCRAKRDQLEKNYNFMFNTVLGGVTYGGIIGTGCHVRPRNSFVVNGPPQMLEIIQMSQNICRHCSWTFYSLQCAYDFLSRVLGSIVRLIRI